MSSEHRAPQRLEDEGILVCLTYEPLDVPAIMTSVRSAKAGATVLFAGTTRDNFAGQPVTQLQYTSYIPRALKTMLAIAQAIKVTHSLTAISMIHRLGICPVGEESIVIAVSAPHRHAAWRGGEEALEECKENVEVWKMEEVGGEDGGVWRANRADRRRASSHDWSGDRSPS